MKTAKKMLPTEQPRNTSRGIEEADHAEQQVSTFHDLHALASEYTASKIRVIVHTNNKPVTLEVDSSKTCILASIDTFRSAWPTSSPKLKQYDIYLRTWSGPVLQVLVIFSPTRSC